ncbi:tandem-95 repeat protein [Brevibacillus sp. GCM10020057]|uniref:tandem-95 repeat protein n=1 Tax=Brevibacillus sp. GCM10020057 TaxID=3317327 RepID=UPI0036310183
MERSRLLLQLGTRQLYKAWMLLLCALIGVGVLPVQQPAKAATSWNKVTGLPTGNFLLGVRYGGGEWLSMGASATLLVSSDGQNWDVEVPTGASDEWADAAHDGQHWTVVGSGGKIFTSNANSARSGWSPRVSGVNENLWSIAYDGSKGYVAVGDGGRVLVSTNGTTWVPKSLPAGASDTLYGVAYGDGMFAIASQTGKIYTSPDGNTWSSAYNGSSPLNGIQYGNGTFIAVGSNEIITSGDGLSWNRSSVAGEMYGAAYGNGKYVAVGAGGKLLVSMDGQNWLTTESSGTNEDLYAIAYALDQGRFVAAGGDLGPVVLTQVDSNLLGSLTVSTSSLTPGFASDTASYTMNVSDSTASMTITPTAVDAQATLQMQINDGGYNSILNGVPAPVTIAVGTTKIEIKVTSPSGRTKIYTITVQRKEPNLPPTGLTLSNENIQEGLPAGSLVGTLTATDPNTSDTFTYALDPSGDASSFRIQGNQLLTNAVFDYESGKTVYNVTIVATDSGGATFSKAFAINVVDVNEPPTLLGSSKAGQEDTPLSFAPSDFTSYYRDPEQVALQKIRIATLPANGSLTLNNQAVTQGQEIPANELDKLVFTPVLNWFGTTSFTWEGTDGNSYSNAATVTLTIASVNDVPRVDDFVKSGLEEQPVLFMAGDFIGAFHDDDTSDALTQIKITSLPANGTLQLNGTAVTVDQIVAAAQLSLLQYVPVPGWSGTTTFAWLGYDGTSYSATPSVVTITINNVNKLPVVSDSTKTGTEDQRLTFAVSDFTGHFQDLDGETLQKIQITTLPVNGMLTLAGTPLPAGVEVDAADLADLAFTPDANWNGITSFMWKGHDGIDYSAAPAVFTLNIAAVNDPPVAISSSKTGTEDTQLSFSAVDFPYTDVEGDALQKIRIESLPGHGTLRLNGGAVDEQDELNISDLAGPNGLTFTPDANWNGNTSLTWSGSDGQAYSAKVVLSITINPENDKPVASDGTLKVTQNQSKQGNLIADDADGDSLQYQIVTPPAKGTLTLDTATGQFTYTPQRNATGSDSFTFVANDGTVDSETATVRITISAVVIPPAPVYGPTISDIADQIIEPGGSTKELAFTVSDPDNDPRTLVVTAISSNQRLVPDDGIKLSGSGTSRTIQATPQAGEHGVATITVTVSDGKMSASDSFTLTVKAINHPPRAQNGFLLVEEPVPTKGVLQATDEDGDTLTYKLVRQASKGKVTITNAKTGAYTYTPDANSSRVRDDSFTFKVSDGTSESNVATVTISSKASNDAYLQDLRVSEGKLSPAFSTGRTSFTVKVSRDTDRIEVTPTTRSAAATVTVDGKAVNSGEASAPIPLKLGDNSIEVVVTAQTGTRKTYQLLVQRDYLPITDIELAKHSLTMTEGDDPIVLTVRVKPDQEVENQLVWKSSRTSVVTVDQTGSVVARKKGTATITVSSLDGKVKDKVNIKVLEGKIVQLSADESLYVMTTEDSEPVKITAEYKQGTKRDVTEEVRWSTKNRRVASVSKGEIVANGPGSTVITATFNGMSASFQVNVYEQIWVDERKLDLSIEKTDGDEQELRISGELPSKEKLSVQVQIGKKAYDAEVDREENTFAFTHLFGEKDEIPASISLVVKPGSSKKKEQVITLPIRLFDESSVQIKALKQQGDKKKQNYSMTGKLFDDAVIQKIELVEDDELVAVGTIKRGKFEIPSFAHDGDELILRVTSYGGFVQEWKVEVKE